MSKETLGILAHMGTEFKLLRPIFANRERYCRDVHGVELNYAASYWTPPLTPRLAFDLERRQIEDHLQLPALISITDHDDIQAPLLLRSIPSAQNTPVSVEWTVPYRDSVFHLGIHNLPGATAADWMRTFAQFTAAPSPARLNEMLSELNALPNTLIVFNHPVWDLHKLGAERHLMCVNEFLTSSNQFIHAMELNGLRNWQENRQVQAVAQKWNQLLISGGDRHGVEPNATTNLTHAASFDEFVTKFAANASAISSSWHSMPSHGSTASYSQRWMSSATTPISLKDRAIGTIASSILIPMESCALCRNSGLATDVRQSSFGTFSAECGFWEERHCRAVSA